MGSCSADDGIGVMSGGLQPLPVFGNGWLLSVDKERVRFGATCDVCVANELLRARRY